jgi:hypothetical protein
MTAIAPAPDGVAKATIESDGSFNCWIWAKIKFLGVTVGFGGGLCLNLPGFKTWKV